MGFVFHWILPDIDELLLELLEVLEFVFFELEPHLDAELFDDELLDVVNPDKTILTSIYLFSSL